MTLNERSIQALDGVHPDLVRVVYRAADITTLPFIVTEGLRDLARQRALVNAGAAQTLNSRHMTGHAVDLAPVIDGHVRWDWPLFYQLATTMEEAARIEGVPIEWGGAWVKFKDGPHWQLPRSRYPSDAQASA